MRCAARVKNLSKKKKQKAFTTMDDAEFQDYLRRFKVVRKRDYINIEYNKASKGQAKLPPSALASKASAPAAKEEVKVKAKAPQASIKSFWEELGNHFKEHYTPQEAATLMQHVRYHHQGSLNNLNLEDLNDLCAEEAP
jgi:hypothetical protein